MMSRVDAERILARWGWTPEHIAALSDERIAFVAEDVPRDTAFRNARLGEPVPPRVGVPQDTLRPQTVAALAEIRRVGLGETRVDLPIGAAALKEALENIAR